MRFFDGLVCFGGADWWYHNRGHYDIQMCRQFAEHVPVLYVNSIGVRTPSVREGAMFLRRATRKLASWRRGFTRIESRFAVLSPLAVPGRVARGISRPVVRNQIRLAVKRMGMSRPLVWVECPTALEFARHIDHAGMIYQRTDKYEEFPGADPVMIRECDRRLKQSADVTLFCSNLLYTEEAAQCRRPCFVDHGVEFERFRQAGNDVSCEPEDMKSIARPRVGFVGGIDAHTFDAALFCELARQLPGMSFVLVGQCSLPAQWCREPNVVLLGQKPYESVPAYMAACDVLIMPWNDNPWIRVCNPVKLKEYLAVGRPVVSSPFDELNKYADQIAVANDANEFVSAIRNAIREPGDSTSRQARVRGHTWSAKAAECQRYLRKAGLVMQGMPEAVAVAAG